ncbi:S1C family serine protease [Rubrobacter calidifluminis]|uniref:S1C family serine protease n=1 Tax=Rubrobacter calidifluminis TaxID=1392640 RepID=UPI00235F4C2E|nr:trypsin-like peptidase domain-containing protein [Rubrobacter calidifluminis]
MRSRRAFLLLLSGLIVGLLAAGCGNGSNSGGTSRTTGSVAQTVPAAPSSIPKNQPVARVYAQLSPSVVQVNVREVQQTPFGPQSAQGIGSGVIYRSDGYIITAAHVVQGASSVNVAFADGSIARAQVVGRDAYDDIAVLKVNRNNLPAAKFSGEKNLRVGEWAVAIGSPSGFQSTVTFGVVSGTNRSIPSRYTGGVQVPSLTGLIQTDAAISPGNSGGALANIKGEVIGINEAYLPPGQTGAENIGFAIPARVATSVADQIISHGKVVHPYLGVYTVDLTPSIAGRFGISVDHGAIIVKVAKNSPAESAGLKRTDVITRVGSYEVQSTGDLVAALRNYRPGDTVKVTVVHGGSKQTIDVKLGQRPAGSGG